MQYSYSVRELKDKSANVVVRECHTNKVVKQFPNTTNASIGHSLDQWWIKHNGHFPRNVA